MGLFSKAIQSEKFPEIERQFKSISSHKAFDEEYIKKIDEFIMLCSSLSIAEAKQFDKNIKKQSQKDRYGSGFDHAVYGSLYDYEDVINTLVDRVNYWKRDAKRALAIRNTYRKIQNVTPAINEEATLERKKLSEIPEIKVKNITKSFDKDAKLPTFVVLDIETTGLKPSSDRIVQICAMRYELFEPTEAFVTYVNPEKHISEEASKVNGIYDDDVKDAPQLAAISESLLEFIGTSAIVGFNVSFDLQFLFCSGVDLISKRKIYDAKALAKKLYKDDIYYYSLENVLKYHGIHLKDLHNAKVDCFATGMVFTRMLDEITSY